MSSDIEIGNKVVNESACGTCMAFERGRKNSTKQLIKDLANGKLEAQFGVRIDKRDQDGKFYYIQYREVRKDGDDKFAQYMANRRDIKIYKKATFFSDKETGVCFVGHFPYWNRKFGFF